MLAISETWIDDDTNCDLLHINDYNFIHFDNNGEFIGKQGVGLYIKKKYTFNIKNELHINSLMSLTIEIPDLKNIGMVVWQRN